MFRYKQRAAYISSDMSKIRSFIVGAGMTPFCKPGSRNWDYPDMGRLAGEEAMSDAAIGYGQIEAVVASYCYGEPTSGQKAVYELGLTGIPIFNVNNNCSSASSALMLARHLIQSGTYQCVMALGFEKMERGLSERFPEKISPVSRHFDHMIALGAPAASLPRLNKMTSEVIKMYAYAALEYLEKYPEARREDFAKIAWKNRQHGARNSRASFHNKPLASEDLALKDQMLCDPITVHQSSLTADGAAAAIIASETFTRACSAGSRAVEIVAQHMCTDMPSTFAKSFMDLSGYDMARRAADACYRETGLLPADVDVIEVHDCFAANELFMYEALGLARPGEGYKLVRGGGWVKNRSQGDMFQLGRRWVVNPSGGLESKGHPIGATGLGQCFELVMQLRNEAGDRQVENAKVALQHNFGIGGAAVLTMYRKACFDLFSKL